MKRGLLAIGVLLMASAQQAWSWGEPHRTIARAVVQTLPAWQRELIKEETKAYTYTYCLYPDSAPDDPVTKPYIMPGAGMRMHLPQSRAQNQEILDYYFPLVAELFRTNETRQAMRQFGSLTHYLEDSCCPGHVRYGDVGVPSGAPFLLMLEFFKQYMDVPPEKASAALHAVIDGGGFTDAQLAKALEGYQPRLLGASVDEALFYAGQRHEDMHTQAARHLIPMLQAYFKDDSQAFAAEGLAAAAPGARLVADVLYTLLCISQNRIDPAEAAALPGIVSLADLTVAAGMPFSWRTNYGDQPVRNASGKSGLVSTFPADLKAEPLRLLTEAGPVREFAKGYGVNVGTRYTFLLRPGLFKTFSVTVGNQAGLGAEGAVGFRVLLDGKPAADSGIIEGRQPAKGLKAELGQVRELTLETYGKSSGSKSHAVWAEPVLSR
jgi:hypothetical protein